MKKLSLLFTVIFVGMLLVTGWASFQESVGIGFDHVVAFRWGWATLADAYCGFITFYAWVFYKEKCLSRKVVWLIVILAFGNIAMSAYVLLQLYKIRGNFSPARLLLKDEVA